MSEVATANALSMSGTSMNPGTPGSLHPQSRHSGMPPPRQNPALNNAAGGSIVMSLLSGPASRPPPTGSPFRSPLSNAAPNLANPASHASRVSLPGPAAQPSMVKSLLSAKPDAWNPENPASRVSSADKLESEARFASKAPSAPGSFNAGKPPENPTSRASQPPASVASSNGEKSTNFGDTAQSNNPSTSKRQKKSDSAAAAGGDQVVELNVGGIAYATTLSTLRKHPQSTLAQMFQEPFALPRDKDGRWFLDRNGGLFAHILEFLRSDRVTSVAPEDATLIFHLASELAWYGLPHVLPFEELFTRSDVAPGYSLRRRPLPGQKGAVPTAFAHVMIECVDVRLSHVACVHMPGANSLPRPTTSDFIEVVDHYGGYGYKIASMDGNRVILARDASADEEGALPASSLARAGAHPTSDGAVATMPPHLLSILDTVKSINTASPPPVR
ncbi:Kelch repeat-containing protein [Diplonema papillatum]|nr:Kelch repeat-containing protein [Diplonema papillatum]